MHAISITGATGFIGRHLVRTLSRRNDVELRLLARRDLPDDLRAASNITAVRGDILKPETLDGFIEPGGTVVNLVYLRDRSREENLRAAENLAQACAAAGGRRLVHVSTAVVAGRASRSLIDETTPCRPAGDYEATKLAVEHRLLERSRGRFECAILRPTAVFGPGGVNLVKLADELMRGSRLVGYVKSCLYGRRRMNAVCVANVCSAVEFLIDRTGGIDGEVFIVSDDEHPLNNYRDIERLIVRTLGCRDYPVGPIPLPKLLLRTCLRLAGRSNTDPETIYDGTKLRKAGFTKPVSLESELSAFADWLKQRELV